uniref:PNPLA domain-containing protein n=1 Tax=uncultured organism TaxID=155900 RepID=A0A0G3FJ77_9ZZZZ|nr:hypothetical protein [uncultured organism]
MLSDLHNKEFSLSLSGGGALGLSHLGVLSVLEEKNLLPSEILGTSMGAIIGALYAIGLKESEITSIVDKFGAIKKWVKLSLKGNAIVDTTKIETIFKEVFGDMSFKDTKIPLKIITTKLDNSKRVVFSKENNIKLVDALLATMAIPGIFNEKVIDGDIYVDGFLSENLPLTDTKYNTILAVDVLGKNSFNRELPDNIFKTSNVFDMFEKSLRTLIYNQTQKNIECLSDKEIILIEPKTEGFSTYQFNKLKKLRKKGLKATLKV